MVDRPVVRPVPRLRRAGTPDIRSRYGTRCGAILGAMPGALSRREAEVVALLGEHLTHAEIAERLVVSVRTVESHVASARRKLGIDGHRALVRYAAARQPRARVFPLSLSPFVGRVEERAELGERLRRQRLVSWSGPAGSARRGSPSRSRPPGRRVRRPRLVRRPGAGHRPFAVPGAVSRRCGSSISRAATRRTCWSAASAALRVCCVLDNCEHLLDAAALLVERLLSDCPELHVLLTSRARLALPFEHVHHVEGLAGGRRHGLFEHRARTAGAARSTPNERAPRVVCAPWAGCPGDRAGGRAAADAGVRGVGGG